MKFKLSTENIARMSGKHPWITIVIWIIVLTSVVFVSSNLLGDALTMEDDFTNNPESKRANKILEKRIPDYDKVQETIVIDSKLKVDDPEYMNFVTKLMNWERAIHLLPNLIKI